MEEQRVINGRYQIERLIGQGGIGQVFYGHDLLTNEPVAIKVLKPYVVEQDPKLLERFRREGNALKELNHPNIVKMLDAIEEGDRHYIVMEYVSGGSLYEVLKQDGRLPIERVLYIALDLCDALTRAHRLKIIHRDIKPANILMAPDGTPRLTDFGAARIEKLTNLTKEGSVIGTVSYLSPEACQGEHVDGRTDIWSFGILLYELMTGSRPFDRPEIIATVLAIVKEPLPDLGEMWRHVPTKFVDLIYRMLDKDPETRIGTMRQVGVELESIIEHADSGIKYALDLIYRMLEKEGGRSGANMRVIGELLGTDLARSDMSASLAATNAKSLKASQFERAEQASTVPAAPTPTVNPRARQIIMGLALLNVVQLVIIILLLLAG